MTQPRNSFTLAHCWAHVRRKFVEVEEQHPGRCTEVLDLIGQLYDIEREAKEKPPDEVLALRKERSKSVVLAIQNWALEVEALPESNLGKAISYMSSAILYTLTESAKLAGVGPHTYLKTGITAALRDNQIPLPHELA